MALLMMSPSELTDDGWMVVKPAEEAPVAEEKLPEETPAAEEKLAEEIPAPPAGSYQRMCEQLIREHQIPGLKPSLLDAYCRSSCRAHELVAARRVISLKERRGCLVGFVGSLDDPATDHRVGLYSSSPYEVEIPAASIRHGNYSEYGRFP